MPYIPENCGPVFCNLGDPSSGLAPEGLRSPCLLEKVIRSHFRPYLPPWAVLLGGLWLGGGALQISKPQGLWIPTTSTPRPLYWSLRKISPLPRSYVLEKTWQQELLPWRCPDSDLVAQSTKAGRLRRPSLALPAFPLAGREPLWSCALPCDPGQELKTSVWVSGVVSDDFSHRPAAVCWKDVEKGLILGSAQWIKDRGNRGLKAEFCFLTLLSFGCGLFASPFLNTEEAGYLLLTMPLAKELLLTTNEMRNSFPAGRSL